jgi:hypothetical protein
MAAIVGIMGLLLSLYMAFRHSKGNNVANFIFIFSAVHIFYIFPKVISLSLSDDPIVQYYNNSEVSFYVSMISLSCYFSAIITYSLVLKSNVKKTEFFKISAKDDKRIIIYAFCIGFVSIFSTVLLAYSNGGFSTIYFASEYYNLEFRGQTVWLLFVQNFIYVSIAALAISVMSRPTRLKIIFLLVLCVIPLTEIFRLYRRSDILILGYIFLYTIVVIANKRISRIQIFTAGIIAFIMIVAFPNLRQDEISTVHRIGYQSSNMTLLDQVSDSFSIRESGEIVRAASIVQNTLNGNDLGMGTFVWNSIVQQFLPSALVGDLEKQSYMVNQISYLSQLSSGFDAEKYFYVAPMGFSEAFAEFHIFGFVIFAIFGAIIAHYEKFSYLLQNRIFLIIAIPIICLGATNDIGSVPAKLLTAWLLSRAIGLINPQKRRLT